MLVISVSRPLVIAGPMIRHTTREAFTIWLVTSESVAPDITVKVGQQSCAGNTTHEHIQVGEHAFVNLLTFLPEQPLDTAQRVEYELQFAAAEQQTDWQRTLSTLLYPGQRALNFWVPEK